MKEIEFNPLKFEKDTWSDEEGYFIVDFITNEFTYVNREYVYTSVVSPGLLSGVILKAAKRGAENYILKTKVTVYNNKLIFGRTAGVEKYIRKISDGEEG